MAKKAIVAVPRRVGALAALALAVMAPSGRAQTSPAPAPNVAEPPAPAGSPPPVTNAPPPLEPSPLSQQAPPPAGAPAPPSDGTACFPACRQGFVCAQSRCVSLCNPPCPSDQTCIDGGRCDYAPAASSIVEPPPPRPVPFAERGFQMLSFHYGFQSDIELEGEPDLHDDALGVNLRSDVPIVPYFLVGPMLEFASYEPGYYFDLDLTLRPRIPIDLKSVQLQFWAGMPIGLTFSFLRERYARSFDSFALGWNIGVLGGGAIHLSREFGLFTEFGWQQHKMTHDRVTGGSVGFRLAPVVWNVGLVFRG